MTPDDWEAVAHPAEHKRQRGLAWDNHTRAGDAKVLRDAIEVLARHGRLSAKKAARTLRQLAEELER